MRKLIYESGGRLTPEEKEIVKANNLFVYQLRSHDAGCGFNVEKGVLVNHIGDWVTNFEIEFENEYYQMNDDDFYKKYDVEYVSLEEILKEGRE